MNLEHLLRERDVVAQRGISRSLLWSQIKEGLFPPPVQIGKIRVAWPSSEVQAVVCALIAGVDNDRLRTLVKRLVDRRTGAFARFEEAQGLVAAPAQAAKARRVSTAPGA